MTGNFTFSIVEWEFPKRKDRIIAELKHLYEIAYRNVIRIGIPVNILSQLEHVINKQEKLIKRIPELKLWISCCEYALLRELNVEDRLEAQTGVRVVKVAPDDNYCCDTPLFKNGEISPHFFTLIIARHLALMGCAITGCGGYYSGFSAGQVLISFNRDYIQNVLRNLNIMFCERALGHVIQLPYLRRYRLEESPYSKEFCPKKILVFLGCNASKAIHRNMERVFEIFRRLFLEVKLI